jgi:hypothetical protein
MSQDTSLSFEDEEALVEREAWQLFACALTLALVAVAAVAAALSLFF